MDLEKPRLDDHEAKMARADCYKLAEYSVKLFQMIKEEQQFDFIYVDGSHLLLDCYTDIILSWKILAKGGLLAIDDYLYVSTENMYQSPLAGVNHFLLKHREEIKILHKGYRVFLIKL